MADFINTIDVLGDEAVVDSLIDRSITEFKDDAVSKVGDYAFYGCKSLKDVELSNATSVGRSSFQASTLESIDLPSATALNWHTFNSCKGLKKVSCPKVTKIEGHTFDGCSMLSEAYFPKATLIGFNVFSGCAFTKVTDEMFPLAETVSQAFGGCSKLTVVDLPLLSSIKARAFSSCTKLATLVLRNSEKICTLEDSTSTLASTLIASGAGYIYVPRALVDSYKVATNWSAFANQFRALEDYTVDGTTTGDLDETKI